MTLPMDLEMKTQVKTPRGKSLEFRPLPSFVADVHLGKLAKMLWMLGIDSAYRNNYSNSELVKIVVDEKRILLSKNARFGKSARIHFLFVQNENV